MANRAALFLLLNLGALFILIPACVGQAAELPIEEPAVIVVEPGRPVQVSGSRLSLTCVAYGQPVPTISWSIQLYSFGNYTAVSSNESSVEIYETIVFDGLGYGYTVSVLELNGVDWTITQHSFACEAYNGVYSSEGLGDDTRFFNIFPEVYEPATLVAVPPEGPFSYNGSRVSLTCASYGSPVPEITWDSTALGLLNNFSGVDLDIITREVGVTYFDEARQLIVTTGDVVVVSILEICASNLTSLEYLLQSTYSCSVFNGYFGYSLGPINASFNLNPQVSVVSFDFQQLRNSAGVSIQFSAPIDSFDPRGCDIRNLVFLNSSDLNTTVFQPRYPGSCTQPYPTAIVYYMDTRDYTDLLEMSINSQLFVSLATSYLLWTEELVPPPLSVAPIQSPLPVTNFFNNVFGPTLLSFDIDFNSGGSLLHFDGLVDIYTIDFTAITLADTEMFPVSTYTLTGGMVINSARFSTTVCVALASDDLEAIVNSSICTSPDSCFMNSTARLVQDYSGNEAVNFLGKVSSFRQIFSPADVSLYMTATVQYTGCSSQIYLGEYEPFIVRDQDTVTRIECISTADANPVLGWEIGERFEGVYFPPENFTSDQPDRAFAVFNDGLPSYNFGIYTCENDNNEKIAHFFDDDNPFIGVLNTDYPITVKLYNPVYIRVAFAQLPPLLLSSLNPTSDISLTDLTNQTVEDVSVAIFNHSIVFSWDAALYSLDSSYFVQVNSTVEVNGSFAVAETTFQIAVEDPSVTIFPSSVITIGPNDEQLTIQCITNSPELPVAWSGGALIDLQYTQSPAGVNSMLQFEVPTDLSIDGSSFTCQVRDPEDPSSIVASTSALVRYVPDELTIYLGGNTLLDDNAVINVDDSTINVTNLVLYGFGTSGNYDLSWTSQPVGEDEPVLITSQTSMGLSAEYDINIAILTVENFRESYRGILRCESAESGRFLQISIVNGTSILGFQFTVEDYIGIAVAIFCTFFAMVIFLFSCVCTSGKKHFVTAYLVHLSLVSAVMCSYWVYYGGVERALENRIGCAATAALLQYFFTAVFTWILCESLLVAFFEKCSKNLLSYIAFFVLGWGLPVIPTAITLGVLHQQYGSDAHCWFEVDDTADNSVLWAFVVPKLCLIALTAAVLVFAGVYNCCCTGSDKLKNATGKIYMSMIWFVLGSVLVTLLLLSGVWVFALLAVNQYWDPTLTGWLFMAFSIALGLFVVLFSLVVTCLNWRMVAAIRTGSDLPGGIEADDAQLIIDNPTFMMSDLDKPAGLLGEPVQPVTEQPAQGQESGGEVKADLGNP